MFILCDSCDFRYKQYRREQRAKKVADALVQLGFTADRGVLEQLRAMATPSVNPFPDYLL